MEFLGITFIIKMGRSSTSNNVVTKFSSYLDSGVLEMQDASSFEILPRGKVYEGRFSVLFVNARNLLTIPISYVALEQTSSAGGRVVDNKMMNLAEEAVECYVCLRD